MTTPVDTATRAQAALSEAIESLPHKNTRRVDLPGGRIRWEDDPETCPRCRAAAALDALVAELDRQERRAAIQGRTNADRIFWQRRAEKAEAELERVTRERDDEQQNWIKRAEAWATAEAELAAAAGREQRLCKALASALFEWEAWMDGAKVGDYSTPTDDDLEALAEARAVLEEGQQPGECHGNCAAEYMNFGCPRCRALADKPLATIIAPFEKCAHCGSTASENVTWSRTGGWTCAACGESDYPEAAS